MKFENIKSAVTRKIHKVGFEIKKNSPTLLVGAGIAGVIGASVMACKATLKVDEVVKERDAQIEKIKNYVESAGYSEEYTVENHKKDRAIVQVQYCVKLAKLYAPAVALGALSISCIVYSHSILNKRNTALAAAYATVDHAFKDYRGRVVERFGEELDKELRYNIKSIEVECIEKDEVTGEEKVVKKVVTDPTDPCSGYSRYFEQGNPFWKKDAQQNRFFLKQQQSYLNQKLKSEGHLFLNDVYSALGFQKTPEGQVVGWVYEGDKDGYVDFGMDSMHPDAQHDFENGIENWVLLDFNVDGVIINNCFGKC